ncbi:mas-related G-protein coupled receptor member D-like [Macrotis lagotis]|uniref:mas-related G-protein coupled receptor member D-like n=1 Tax=Macrotis lagotis TaxID=92651 RepID=UPI003D685923
MAIASTPDQLEYAHDNETERSGNNCLVPVALGKFELDNRVQIPILIITLVGFVGNSIVLWLLGFRIPRNSFSVYILNLAGADALYLCGSFLISINKMVCYLDSSFIHNIVNYITYLSYSVGLSLLVAVSTKRCLSVLFPIWYRCHRPKHTSATICAVLWILTGFVWLVLFVLCVSKFTDNICYDIAVIIFVWFLLLTCTLAVSSLALLLGVQCSSRRRQPPRLYLLVLLTVLVFLICGVPLGMISFLMFYKDVSKHRWLPRLLACVNSSANPFIYFFLGIQRHRRWRESLRLVLQRALEEEQHLEGETGDTPSHTNTLDISS